MQNFFAFVGALVNFAACLSYVRAVLRGEAVPNRVTWLLWTALPLIAGAAQWRAGVGISTLVVLSAGAGPACVLAASLSGKASWALGPFDYVCGGCALAALALWGATGDPALAIALSIAGDVAACLPTVRKAWIAPETEDRRTFLVSFVGMIFGMLSVRDATFAGYAFNFYLLAATGLLVAILYLPRRRPVPEASSVPPG